MSRSEKAFMENPPDGISSKRPSSSSRTSAMRIGVRETPRRSTTESSEMRSPGLSSPDRIRSRRLSSALTVCDDARSNVSTWVTHAPPGVRLAGRIYWIQLVYSRERAVNAGGRGMGPSGSRPAYAYRLVALRDAEIFLQHGRIG